MRPHRLILGDAQERLPPAPAGSVTAIVTDPPYGLKFMGKEWDHGVPGVLFWTEALRVAKPGAPLFAFGGTRTFHRLACAIEDAGWEIRDTVMWVYGSGFPKSLDISKAIDKAAGAKREVTGEQVRLGDKKAYPLNATGSSQIYGKDNDHLRNGMRPPDTAPATDAAKQWDGWGTALKPAWEPVIVAMKPLDGTFAQNAEKHGVAGLNIDGGRIETGDNLGGGAYSGGERTPISGESRPPKKAGMYGKDGRLSPEQFQQPGGRWPANVVHDGSEEVMERFPETGKSSGGGMHRDGQDNSVYGKHQGHVKVKDVGHGDSGSAARFYYTAKASRNEREHGLRGRVPCVVCGGLDTETHLVKGKEMKCRRNNHPTVKPLALMRWLVRLASPPKAGVILDPFMGSGTTLLAADLEGQGYIGIDNDSTAFKIAQARILGWREGRP